MAASFPSSRGKGLQSVDLAVHMKCQYGSERQVQSINYFVYEELSRFDPIENGGDRWVSDLI